MANQTQNLAAILDNFNGVLQAHDLALNADGSAMDENARAMENLNKKLDAVKASWAEVVLAFANSEKIGKLLDRVSEGLRAIAENKKAIAVITEVAKLILYYEGIKIGSNLFGGMITSTTKVITALGNAKKKLGDFFAFMSLAKEFGLGKTIAELGTLEGAVGGLSAASLPLIGIGAALGVTLGIVSGKFKEMHNQHIAETSDDVNKVADAYLNLIKAQKSYDSANPKHGSSFKNVTGSDALDEEIKRYERLQKMVKDNEITLEQFKTAMGDTTDLRNYYDSLNAIIDSGGKLTKEQREHYNSLKKLFNEYDNVNKKIELHAKAQKVAKVYTGLSKQTNEQLAKALVLVGNQYQFVSQAAKNSAISQMKSEQALTQNVLKQAKARLNALTAAASVGGYYSYSSISNQSYKVLGLQKKLNKINASIKKAMNTAVSGISTSAPAIDYSGLGDTSGGSSGGGGGSTSTSKKEKEAEARKKAQERLLKALQKKYEKYQKRQLELYQKGRISADKYYSRIEKRGRIYYKRVKDMTDDYKSAVSASVNSIFDEIDYKYDKGKISAKKYYDTIKKYAKKFYKNGRITFAQYRDYINKGMDALKEASKKKAEEAISAQEKVVAKWQAKVDKKNAFIDALQFYADEQMEGIDKIIEGYNEEIDKLNEKMNLLDEQNEALDKQAERIKLVNALEDAKKQKTVRVFDESLGWIWTANPQSVKNAQDALDSFDKEQAREQEKKAIQDQIKAIEQLIKEKEKEKKKYQDVVDEQTKALNRYNIEAELGMKIEQAIFGQREQNFENWKNAYLNGIQELIAAMKALALAQQQLEQMQQGDFVAPKQPSIAGGASTAGSTVNKVVTALKKPSTKKKLANKIESFVKKTTTPSVKPSSSKKTSSSSKKTTTSSSGKKKKASGSISIPQTDLYNVNELGDELIIPPSGNFDYLKKGTGVVPAHLTKNLMDLGQYSLPQWLSMVKRQNGGNTDSHDIVIQNMTVQSNNAQDFVRDLRNLSILKK